MTLLHILSKLVISLACPSLLTKHLQGFATDFIILSPESCKPICTAVQLCTANRKTRVQKCLFDTAQMPVLDPEKSSCLKQHHNFSVGERRVQ